MESWPINKEIDIARFKHFRVKAKRLESTSSKRFKNEYIKFKLEISEIKAENNELVLNDENFNLLQKALLNIFDKIKKSFNKRKADHYIQLNLKFDSLKLKWLKS